jgi:hypothetical protein
MDSTEIYALYAAAAIIGLMNNKTNVNHVAEFADVVARDMIALQAAWAKENGL